MIFYAVFLRIYAFREVVKLTFRLCKFNYVFFSLCDFIKFDVSIFLFCIKKKNFTRRNLLCIPEYSTAPDIPTLYTSSSTPESRLEDNRKTVLHAEFHRFVGRRDRPVGSRHDRHPSFYGGLSGGDLSIEYNTLSSVRDKEKKFRSENISARYRARYSACKINFCDCG